MAHAQKMKRTTIAPMLHHYRRDREATLDRDNIDETRTHLNYTVGHDDVQQTIRDCVKAHNAAGRALRDDAVLMVDWVITAPQDLPEGRTEEFFERCLEFLQKRYGEENVPCGFAHGRLR